MILIKCPAPRRSLASIRMRPDTCACVHVSRRPLMRMQRDLVCQQWLGATAEWSVFLSVTESLLGNRLAVRLQSSSSPDPTCGGRNEGWRGAHAVVRLICSLTTWFVNMRLDLWHCHILSETHISWWSWVGAWTPLTPFLSWMLFIGSP